MRLSLTILAMTTSILMVSCTHMTRNAQREASAVSRGPYLAMGDADQMTIVWRGRQHRRPVVRIGSHPDTLDRKIEGKAITRRHGGGHSKNPLDSAPKDIVQYEASITGLQPATKYYYGIYYGRRRVAGGDESYWFCTSPVEGSAVPFRIWTMGDSGTGGEMQAKVHQAMRDKLKRDGKGLDLYLHAGDMAYNSGTDGEFQRHFFEPYDVTLRNTVCWPTMGNHEGLSSLGPGGTGPYYDAYVLPTRGEIGGVASGTETYYSFNYANAHFVCLNSYDIDRRPDAAMARWLRADLESASADWLIAFWHHPPYSKGSHDSDTEIELIQMRENIMPILEAGGVDVVITGHSHTYERSMLMDGAYDTPTVAENFIFDDGDGDPDGDGAYRKSQGLHAHNGTVQVVAGTGGTGVGRAGTMPVMKRVVVENGSVIVDIDDDTLTAVMINAEGGQKDLFSVVKRGAVVQNRIAEPKQLPVFFNWEAIEAVMKATTNVSPGVRAPFSIEIQAPITNSIQARIAFNTNGTSWTVYPDTLEFSMASGTTRLMAEGSYSDRLFPLAKMRLIMMTDEGEKQGKGRLVLEAYKQARIRRMTALPKIDGHLKAHELAGLDRMDDMIEYNGTGAPSRGTEFFLGIYENQLYVSVINHEPEIRNMIMKEYERDGGVFNDHCNEIFMQLSGEREYFQFVVGSGGHIFDGKDGPGPAGAAWDGEWYSAVQRGDDRWTAEVLIPLNKMMREVRAGDVLRFNITRYNPLNGELSQWSHTYQKGHHQPQYFGSAVVE